MLCENAKEGQATETDHQRVNKALSPKLRQQNKDGESKGHIDAIQKLKKRVDFFASTTFNKTKILKRKMTTKMALQDCELPQHKEQQQQQPRLERPECDKWKVRQQQTKQQAKQQEECNVHSTRMGITEPKVPTKFHKTKLALINHMTKDCPHAEEIKWTLKHEEECNLI